MVSFESGKGPASAYLADLRLRDLAADLGLWEGIVSAIVRMLPEERAIGVLGCLASLPVQKSRAVYSLGSYVSRKGYPHGLRLQFAQEPQQLRETLLHEIAHACDHLLNQPGQRYRRAHGPGWKAWAAALGIDPSRTGHSPQLEDLRRRRLKLVAVCTRCGAEIRRIRRLPRRRRFIHPPCGGQIRPLPETGNQG